MSVESNLNHAGDATDKSIVLSDIQGGQTQQGLSVFTDLCVTRADFSLYSNVEPHTEAKSLFYLPSSSQRGYWAVYAGLLVRDRVREQWARTAVKA